MTTIKKGISGKLVGRAQSTSKGVQNHTIKVKSSKIKRINLSADTHNPKVFGTWLSNIIPDLDMNRGRVDDDDTMMKIVRIARQGIAQKQYAILKKELQFSKEDW